MLTSDNKRIAKNTVMLYFRMLITMGLSLYTSRLVLSALGVEDFGIYNVVGGVVIMLSFLNGAMIAGTSRFLSFELGRKDYEQLKRTFSATLTIHIAIAGLVFLLAETIGLWFMTTQLVIPADRLETAHWVYQLSILSCMVQLTQVPYTASIIAHERMNVFAYVGIIDVLLKLLLVFALIRVNSIDKLKFYAILIFCASVTTAMIYRIYCKRQYEECRYNFEWDKKLYKQLISFSGWDLIGISCVVTQVQGLNMLLNIFFGPIVNAAQGISSQVQNALGAFSSNFMTAVQPQIYKLYAENNIERMLELVFASSKYSFYLLWFLSLPVLLETNFILQLWLKNVPEHTVIFLQLVLLVNLIRTLARPVIIAVHASGDIKNLNLYAGGLGLLPLPVAYIFLKLGYAAESVFIILMIYSILANLAELIILKQRVLFSLRQYVQKVYLKCILVCIVSTIIPLLAHRFLAPELVRFFIVGFACAFSVIVTVYWVGIDVKTRKLVIDKLRLICKKKIYG